MKEVVKKRLPTGFATVLCLILVAALVTGCNSGPAPGSKEEAAAFAGNPNSPQAQAAARAAAQSDAARGAAARSNAEQQSPKK